MINLKFALKLLCVPCLLLQACTSNLSKPSLSHSNKSSNNIYINSIHKRDKHKCNTHKCDSHKCDSHEYDKDEIEKYLNNPEDAKQFLKNRLDDPYCSYLLGTIYLTEKNYKLANKYITLSANAGCLEAINSLADGYYSGDIRPKNIKLAQQYYLKAANGGYGPAQINAGSVYFRHGNTVKDMKKALYWFNKAYNNEEMKEFRPYIPMFKSQVKEKIKSLK